MLLLRPRQISKGMGFGELNGKHTTAETLSPTEADSRKMHIANADRQTAR